MIDELAPSKSTALRSKPKFVEEPDTIYNGMRPEELRRESEAILDELLDKLIIQTG